MKNYLANSYFAEHHRWVHWLPVGLIFGIAFYFALRTEPNFWDYSFLTVIAIKACFFKAPKLRWLVFLIVGFCLGFCVIGIKVWLNPVPMFNDTQKNVEIFGKIQSIENHPYKDDETFKIVIDQVTINKINFPAKLRLNAKDAQNWNIGDNITAEVSIYPIPMPNSLHGYFARRAAFLQGIAGTARLQRLISHENVKDQPFAKYRHALTQALLTKLQAPYGSIAAALTTGDRSYIPKNLRQAFADAGLAHVLAISGLHLSLITGLIFLFLRRLLCLIPALSNRFSIKKIAAVLAVLASSLYMAIANFGIPVQRSFVMISLAMLAICLDRTAFSMRSLAIAAIIVLVLSPESLLSASFQLSFAAVLGLLAFYESGWTYLQEKFLKNSSNFLGLKKILWGILGIFMTTLIASLATTPFSIAFFQRFTAQAVLGNIIAIPVVGFLVMPLGLLSVISLVFGGFDSIFFLWEKSLHILCAIANHVADLPGAAIKVKAVPSHALVIFAIGMLWLCLWKKSWRWLGLAPICAGIFLWRAYEPPIAYVSGQCDIMGYQQDSVAYISDDTRNTFTSDTWAQEWGIKSQQPWNHSYQHFKELDLLLITNPKDGINYLKQLNKLPETVITFGYAKTLKKHNINIHQVIDRNIIAYENGLAIFPKNIIFLKDYFGKRSWCVRQ